MYYGRLFEGWEIAIAKKLVNHYKRENKSLKHEDFDDLLQECLILWIRIRGKYDSSRCLSKKAFMSGVIKNKLAKIIEKLITHKRKIVYESISLDTICQDEDKPVLKDKIMDMSGVHLRINSDLNMKLSQVLEMLTPQQKELCRLISEEGMTINQACKHFNKHRSSIYRDVLKIRKIFEESGLKNYLK